MRIFSEFSKYIWVAICSALADWLIFTLLTELGTFYVFSQMVSRVVGGLVSFLLNRYWNFTLGRKNRMIKSVGRFVLLYIVSYGLSLLIISTLVEVIRLESYYGKLIADITCFLFNFFVMRSYVFHTREGLSVLIRRHINKSP